MSDNSKFMPKTAYPAIPFLLLTPNLRRNDSGRLGKDWRPPPPPAPDPASPAVGCSGGGGGLRMPFSSGVTGAEMEDEFVVVVVDDDVDAGAVEV